MFGVGHNWKTKASHYCVGNNWALETQNKQQTLILKHPVKLQKTARALPWQSYKWTYAKVQSANNFQAKFLNPLSFTYRKL